MSQSAENQRLSEPFLNVRPSSGIGLEDGIKKAIINAVWGKGLAQAEYETRTAHWFRYYETETTWTAIFKTSRQAAEKAPLRTHAELLGFIHFLKENPHQPRKQLKEMWKNPNAKPIPGAFDLDEALDLAVRLMLMTACRSPTADNVINLGQIYRPSWEEEETLEEFTEKVFSRYEVNQENGAEAIRIEKLTAYYLMRRADIQIEWTNHLPDHLILVRGTENKFLYVFGQAGFLETCALWSSRDKQKTTGNSNGCLPINLVNETLATLQLLFPPNDRKSRSLLVKEIKKRKLDQRLSASQLYQGCHISPRDALQPQDVRTLGEKFPHWGLRLYTLWHEADNPAPISKLGWWSESKKSPRFTFWAGMIALSFAIFFGVVASTLSAIQVWISYCAWKGDGTVACPKHN